MSGNFEMETRSAEWTGSLEYAIGDLVISGEYSRNNYDFWAGGNVFENMKSSTGELYSSNLNKIADGITHVELETEGYYGSVSYRFTDWLEVGTYYSVYYADRDDKDGERNETEINRRSAGYQDHDAWLKDLCLSFRFDINQNWVFKLEGHKMDGAAILMKEINYVDGKLQTEDDWYLGAAKLTFSF
jgi:hypothetical protein